MISVLGTTSKYILQPALIDMHRQSIEWLSVIELWKREFSFYQKILDKHTLTNTAVDFKKEVDHFQNLIIYYNGEVINLFQKRIKEHESKLAHSLQELKESDTEYFTKHKGLMEELDSFQQNFLEFKKSFYDFIERGFSAY